MVRKVVENVLLPTPQVLEDLSIINAELVRLFSAYGFRLNRMGPRDGSEGYDSFTVATVPATATIGAMIFVSDETGGATMAFGDGTNWRRVQDRAIVA